MFMSWKGGTVSEYETPGRRSGPVYDRSQSLGVPGPASSQPARADGVYTQICCLSVYVDCGRSRG
ncbi:hypothetical protein EYF80_044235 [Liparis tanakae]|uniref:Uncharacterized protein n=1 Tax=Liparis tanakae TaxID=230148 RepID=A0A4Z2FWD2_9TELE|nr:hypothetical protein EYF80_044235 [Liparis tanakae]